LGIVNLAKGGNYNPYLFVNIIDYLTNKITVALASNEKTAQFIPNEPPFTHQGAKVTYAISEIFLADTCVRLLGNMNVFRFINSSGKEHSTENHQQDGKNDHTDNVDRLSATRILPITHGTKQNTDKGQQAAKRTFHEDHLRYCQKSQ
jgi:hypothetical protein